jgi:glycosyltransferase involved in cell wall biosynthesis
MSESTAKKIGIDIRPYLLDPSGMGQYAFQLTKHLLLQDKKNTFILFSDRSFDSNVFSGNFSVKVLDAGPITPLRTVAFHIRTILFAKRYCDIYLSTSAMYVAALRKNFGIIVIHDLVIKKFPELQSFKTKTLIGAFIPLALKNAKHIIATSENTKKDIHEFFPDIDENKISVVYQGFNTNLLQYKEQYSEKTWTDIQKKFGITKPYILFVGTTEPRKNILRLIEAFNSLEEENLELVIAGKKGWGYNEIIQHTTEHIHVTGFVTDEEKAYLYMHATMLCYPSLYEGFGIPLLEAMSFSIPIISSNASSLPEVAGDAAILINPTNTIAIAQSMVQLLTDQQLREELLKKEAVQVTKFDWNETAKEIISIYET